MAKKNEEFTVASKQEITNVFGTFDKSDDGAYIIIVDNEEYLFEYYADYFLDGSIEIHAINVNEG